MFKVKDSRDLIPIDIDIVKELRLRGLGYEADKVVKSWQSYQERQRESDAKEKRQIRRRVDVHKKRFLENHAQ